MDNIDIIKELYRAFREKDYDGFRNICTDDIEWIQNEGFPNGSVNRGADAVINNVFKSFSNEWQSWRFIIDEFLDGGISVIVLGFYEGTHRVSGKSFRSPAAHVYDIVDGKISKFRQYTDTKLMWDAMS
jgi:uncharacterized protein